MKVLKLTDYSKEIIDVEYLVDLNGNDDMLTVYQVSQWVDGVLQIGLNDLAIKIGLLDVVDQKVTMNDKIKFDKLTLKTFEQLAANLNLNMTVVPFDKTSPSSSNTAVELAITTSSLAGGKCGVAQVETLTFPAEAAAAQGDYVVLTNGMTGKTLAAWLDKDAAGTAPTGAKYVAADYKVKVPVTTSDTAILIAASFVTEVGKSEWVDGVGIEDIKDGTVVIEQDMQIEVEDIKVYNANDSGDGSITVSIDKEGISPDDYNQELKADGGTGVLKWVLSSGELPNGIVLLQSGKLIGKPTTVETKSVKFKVEDSLGALDESNTLTLTVTENTGA